MWAERIIKICLFVLLSNFHPIDGGIFDFFYQDDAKQEPVTVSDVTEITFSTEQLSQAVEFAESSFERLKTLEESISNSPIQLSNTSSSYAQYLECLPNNQTMEFDRIAEIILKASKYLLNNDCNQIGFDGVSKCVDVISTYKLPPSDLLNQCETIHKTKKDGLHTYRRLLPAKYADALHNMETHLPPPKNVSDEFFELTRPEIALVDLGVATFEGILDKDRNIALVQWSQFIEHDFVKTVVRTMSNGNPIECCSEDATKAPPRYRHPACFPLYIEVAAEDYNRLPSCLNYVRSALGVDADCKFGPAQQINQASNHLDLSQLYGATGEVTATLRSFKNGELQISNDPLSPTLPEIEDASVEYLCMHNTTIDTVCYRSGDSRVNANPYITTLYTLFLRSHNRIAKELIKMHPTWHDEKIFRFAQHINIGIYQKIIYEEWTNVVLGLAGAAAINTQELTCQYNASALAVSNEFATAGIRFYYSMMPGNLKTTKDVSYFVRQNNIIIRPITEDNVLKLKDEFYKPRDLSEDDELDNIVDAILKQKAMAMDSGYVADVVKHFYYQNAEQKHVGTDVLALDILRGRDHGLNSYTNYLEFCTKNPIKNWSDLRPFIIDEDLERLKAIYIDFSDIDLLVGAIAEKPVAGATVGPTLACIIGEQLSNTRQSDKQFYSIVLDPIFKQFVDNYSGAKLICDTTRLTSVPRNIFHAPSEKNPMIYCSDL